MFYIFFALLIAGTIVLLVVQPEQSVWHYLLYVVSAVCLAYFVYTIVHFAPKMKASIIRSLRKHKLTSTMLDDFGYRTMILSIFSFALNIAYVIFMGVLGILSHSAWYISITAYYLVLTLIKGNVFHSKKIHNTDVKRARAYRFCGIMFIFLTLALSGIIVLIYKSNMYFEYAGWTIYAVAAYTFYTLILSIVNIFRARKTADLYVQSIRNVNLASALVSIVVLQVAMFQAFAPQHNTSIANGLTAGAVSLVILTLGIFMIVKANKLLNQMEKTNEK